MEDKIYSEYCAILAEELQPAMGCTEPIAVAYCAALARKTLGCLPEDVQVYASANIIKNVKSVVVPNTGGQRGLTVAAAAGIVAGDADAKLQVLAGITPEQVEQIAGYEKRGIVHVHPSDKDYTTRRTKTLFLTSRCGFRAAATPPLPRLPASTQTSSGSNATARFFSTTPAPRKAPSTLPTASF